jgi:GDSL-like Lipase/Acylhydrolase.
MPLTSFLKFPPFKISAALVSMGVALATLATATAAEFSILPLGDSITDGNGYGGYRAKLMEDLTAAGHTVHMLGSQKMSEDQAAPSLLPPNDGLHHEGHGGWRIDQLDAQLDGNQNIDKGGNGGYFITGGHGTGRKAIQPDIILFLAGINDINQYFGTKEKAGEQMDAKELLPILQKRVTSLVQRLHKLTPRSHILMGTVIPYANGLLKEEVTGATQAQREAWAKEDGVTPDQELGVNHFVILYNKWLETEFIPAQRAKGVKISLVPLYSDFILPDGKVRGWGQEEPNGYADYGLHPNQFAYDLMGATWARAVLELVNSGRQGAAR